MKTITMMKITDAWDKVGPGGLAQRPNYALSTCSDDDDGGEDDDDDDDSDGDDDDGRVDDDVYDHDFAMGSQ